MIIKKLLRLIVITIGGTLLLAFLSLIALGVYLKIYGITPIVQSSLQSDQLTIEDLQIPLPRLVEKQLIFDDFSSTILYRFDPDSKNNDSLKFKVAAATSVISSSGYFSDIGIKLPELAIEFNGNEYQGTIEGIYTFSDKAISATIDFPNLPAEGLCPFLTKKIPELHCRSGIGKVFVKLRQKNSLIEILEANIKAESLNGRYKESTFSNLSFSFTGKGTIDEFKVQDGIFNTKKINLPLVINESSFSFKGSKKQDLTSVTLTNIKAEFLGGALNIKNIPWNSKAPQTSFNATLSHLDLSKIAELYQDQSLKLKGTIDVFANIILTNSLEIVINDGKFSTPPNHGGYIKVLDANEEMSTPQNETLGNVQNILKDFNYSDLSGTLTLEKDGALKLATQIFGSSPLFQNNRAINLNVNLEENVYSLIKSLGIKSEIDQKFDKALKN